MAHHMEFYMHQQKSIETAADFMVHLRRLALTCEFPSLDDAFLDWFVMGIQEEKLPPKVISREELTLVEALRKGATFEKSRQDRQTSATHQASVPSSFNCRGPLSQLTTRNSTWPLLIPSALQLLQINSFMQLLHILNLVPGLLRLIYT
ncbi:UNVERIFIED_CONTAM: hypothetical protein K2H54_023994 [Gekko kuhli]